MSPPRVHRRITQNIAVALALLVPSSAAFAAVDDAHFVTSVDLVTELKNKERLMLGFVTGVHDTLNGVAFCVPNETMPLELVDAILRWAPGRTSVDVSGARMTTQALAAAWPCRRDRMGRY